MITNQKLNLPLYSFKFKTSNNKQYIFDEIRKKFVYLSPEEWVRQNFLKYLVNNRKYPPSLISIEKKIKVLKTSKRFDIMIHNQHGNPNIMVECKSYKYNINQNAFDQISRYNLNLNVNIIIITNGISHYYINIDYEKNKFIFLDNIPIFKL